MPKVHRMGLKIEVVMSCLVLLMVSSLGNQTLISLLFGKTVAFALKSAAKFVNSSERAKIN